MRCSMEARGVSIDNSVPGAGIILRMGGMKLNHTEPNTAENLCRRGLDLLAAGSPAEAALAFRAAIHAGESAAGTLTEAQVEAHHGLVRALRDAGGLEQSVAAALALTALTPGDPLAHTALSISLQTAGHVPEAEAAAARARIVEWKVQLQSPPGESAADGGSLL